MDTLCFKKNICTSADVRLELCILFTLWHKDLSFWGRNSFILKTKTKNERIIETSLDIAHLKVILL